MRAPAAVATSAVRSVLPLSTTTISSASFFGTRVTTFAIVASSFSAAMITDTNGFDFSLLITTQPNEYQSENQERHEDESFQQENAVGSVVDPRQIEKETRER